MIGWTDRHDLNRTLRHLLHVGAENPTGRDTAHLCDWWVDGACTTMPLFAGFDRYGALAVYDQALPQVERHLATPTTVHLKLSAEWRGDRVIASAGTTGLPAQAHPLKVQIVLVEDSIFIPGGNAPIQNHVVRAIAGDSAAGFGFVVSEGHASHCVQETFDIGQVESLFRWKRQKNGVLESDPSSWSDKVDHLDRSQLWIAAYVQDQVTGEVLQAAQVKVPTAQHTAAATR